RLSKTCTVPKAGLRGGTSAAPFHVQNAATSLARSVPAIFLAFAMIVCASRDAANCSAVGSSAALPAPASGIVVSVFVVPKPVAMRSDAGAPRCPRCPVPCPSNKVDAINNNAIEPDFNMTTSLLTRDFLAEDFPGIHARGGRYPSTRHQIRITDFVNLRQIGPTNAHRNNRHQFRIRFAAVTAVGWRIRH